MNGDTGHPHRPAVRRARELGCGTDPGVLPELVQLLASPAAEVRTVAASAIGKLAGFGLDEQTAVCALTAVALHDPDPQPRQSALYALKTCGAASRHFLPDLDHLARNEHAATEVRRAARAATEAIRAAVRHREQEAAYRCARCSRPSSREEHMRSRLVFDQTFCPGCFDEIFFERRPLEPEG